MLYFWTILDHDVVDVVAILFDNIIIMLSLQMQDQKNIPMNG